MTRKHLLFVDDDKSVLNTLHRTLRNLPYQKHFATSAEEGLAYMEKYPIGIVVSDERMPGMNGSEFLQEVRKINPDTVRVILSAYANRKGLDVSRDKCDVNYIIQKPWRSEELTYLLNCTLETQNNEEL